VRLLRNWLRDEPQLETHPADPWFATIAPRVDIAATRLAGFHTVTLSFELKASLPRPGVLCVDVATDVLSASASLVTGSKASSGRTDVLWKGSRVWVTFGESRLEVGDLVNLTVSGAKAISRPATVRIATLVTGVLTAASG
jgi:hypothetical protein